MKRLTQKRVGNPDQRITLHFLGSAGDVSGSLILFEVTPKTGKKFWFLLEAGLHQGDNEKSNSRRRLPRGVEAKDISFVIVSHAHIDHSGWLPALVKAGFKGSVYMHPATKDLLEVLLPDSGRLQEMAAERLNKRLERRRKKQNRTDTWQYNPLYTEEDTAAALARVKMIHFNQQYQLAEGVSMRFSEACHILGAAVVTLTIGTGKDAKSVCFTGNVGRPGTPLLRPIDEVKEADYVITESTYGNRLHEKRDRLEVLAGILNAAHKRALPTNKKDGAGVIVIPAFAVGRVQTVLNDLRKLMESGRIPDMPVFLDSRMAIAATEIHRKWAKAGILDKETNALFASGKDAFAPPRYTECTKPEQTNALYGKQAEPIIIVGSSGMAAGGKILKHLEKRLGDGKNTVLFVGYQGTGALGYELVNEKSKQVRVHGNDITVNATIEYMSDYSGHADYEEMIGWMRKFRKKPKRVFCVHGDPDALVAFQGHIKQKLKWDAVVPQARQSFEL